jgi:hypothetical protein
MDDEEPPPQRRIRHIHRIASTSPVPEGRGASPAPSLEMEFDGFNLGDDNDLGFMNDDAMMAGVVVNGEQERDYTEITRDIWPKWTDLRPSMHKPWLCPSINRNADNHPQPCTFVFSVANPSGAALDYLDDDDRMYLLSFDWDLKDRRLNDVFWTVVRAHWADHLRRRGLVMRNVGVIACDSLETLA